MATGKHVFKGVVEVPKAKKSEQAVNLGQVKDLLDRYNKEPVKVVASEELVVDSIESETGKLTLNDSIAKIDNIDITVGDEILLIAQPDKTQNGVYVVDDLGSVTPSSVSASVSETSTGVTSVTVDKDTFEAQISTTGSYVFTYDGQTENAWKYDGATVTLSDYGITEEGVAADGDEITVEYTEAVIVPPTLSRRADFAIGKVILNNTFVNVMEGETNGDTRWTLVSDGALTCGSSTFLFTKDVDTSAGTINVVKGTITGDGTTTAFNLSHNLNLTDAEAYLIFVKDNSGSNIYVDDVPTIGNEKNSVTLTFDVAPTTTDVFKTFILGLE